MQKHCRVAVLIGGGGRLPALYHATQAENSRAKIELVVSFKRTSAGLEWAAAQGLRAEYFRWSDWKQQGRRREQFDAGLAALLDLYQIELVVLAGWGLLLSDEHFLQRFAGRVINVHPALLTDTFLPEVQLADGRYIPVFRGNDAIGMALAAGVDTTGCTVHYVTAEMDTGEVILKKEVPVLPDDTHASLAERIHQAEDEILPAGVEIACARLQRV